MNSKKRNLYAMIIILAVLSFVISCSSEDTSKKYLAKRESPEIAAKEWFEAFWNMDGNKLIKRTCANQHANVQTEGFWLSAIGVLGKKFTSLQAKADISDLYYKTVSLVSDSACVHVTGEFRIAVLAVSEAIQMDEVWQMIWEDNKWKWCGLKP